MRRSYKKTCKRSSPARSGRPWWTKLLDDRLLNMPVRKSFASNSHLEEAMALLIRNQAAFVEQIARNDQERLKLQIKGEDWMRRTEEWQRKTEEWQRKTEEW